MKHKLDRKLVEATLSFMQHSFPAGKSFDNLSIYLEFWSCSAINRVPKTATPYARREGVSDFPSAVCSLLRLPALTLLALAKDLLRYVGQPAVLPPLLLPSSLT